VTKIRKGNDIEKESIEEKLFTKMNSKSNDTSTGLHSRTLQELFTGASDPKWRMKLK